MKSRSFVLTVSLIAMMAVGTARAADIASTSYVDGAVGDEADLIWTSIDAINDSATGIAAVAALDATNKAGQALADAKKYTDDEITAAMEDVTDAIPTDNTQLANSAGYITSAALSDLATKGELSSGLAGKQDTVSDLADIRSGAAAGATAVQPSALEEYAKASAIPTNNNQLENGAGYITSAALSDLATKGELSSGLAGKQDTVSDLADIRSGAAAGATAVQPSALEEYAKASAIPTNNNQLENGAGYITSAALSDLATKGELSSGLAGKLDTTGSIEISQVNGLGDVLATAGMQPDAELSETSTNAVQNKIITAALNEAKSSASSAASNASAAQAAAEAAQAAAEQAASDAVGSAKSYAEAAAGSATAAAGSASAAADSASSASTKAGEAAASASTASEKATAAAGSASAAADSASSASTKAGEAAASASTASEKATAAAGSASAAADSASSASTKAGEAAASASTASEKATAAANSAIAASNSVSAAADLSSNATIKAGQAAESASTASEKATAAADSATAAASSASAAAGSATTASTAASNAEAAWNKFSNNGGTVGSATKPVYMNSGALAEVTGASIPSGSANGTTWVSIWVQ